MTKKQKMAEIGRLAMRHEGNFWNAYFALPDTMEGAIPLGQSRAAQKGKPGGGTSGSTAVQETPQKQFGKVFFTEKGVNYVCSGTATASGTATS